MTENYLGGEKKGNIYTISLNRPAKRNAITVEMLTGICEMAESQAGDPDIRAIMITAVDDRDVAREAIEEGAVDYVIKPLDLDYLDALITFQLLD